jgi:hypothetical protein
MSVALFYRLIEILCNNPKNDKIPLSHRISLSNISVQQPDIVRRRELSDVFKVRHSTSDKLWTIAKKETVYEKRETL